MRDADIVVFDHGDLIHADCHRVPRRPPLNGVRVNPSAVRARLEPTE